MKKRDYAEDAIGVVLQMYNVPESMSVQITPVLNEVEKIIEAAQQSVYLTAFGVGILAGLISFIIYLVVLLS